MLTGKPPFYGETNEAILKSVMKGLYLTSGPAWSKISPEGQDLIKRMLAFDSDRRISAKDALLHPWIAKNTATNVLSDVEHVEILKNLKEFDASNKLQQATLTFMTTHLISQEETRELKKTFEAMDINRDGRLSKKEILAGYTVLYGVDVAEVEAQRVMEIADIDGNGTIDYTEFMNATVDKSKTITKERLRLAFDFFDKVRSLRNNGCEEPERVHKHFRD